MSNKEAADRLRDFANALEESEHEFYIHTFLPKPLVHDFGNGEMVVGRRHLPVFILSSVQLPETMTEMIETFLDWR
jgi:hypothetical protein